jgi:hypothetical protein
MRKHAIGRIVKRLGTGLIIGASLLLSACDMSASGATSTAATATAPSTTSNATPTTSPGASPGTGAGPSSASGSATISWLPPQQNADGTALTDLAGFHIYYGSSADELSQVVSIATAGISRYVIDNLPGGTWYFAVAAFNAAGVEGDLSNVASKTIS